MKIILLNKTTKERLDKVKEEMQKLGPPVIQCFKLNDDEYLAIEGSHRLTAAFELGMEPVLDIISELDSEDDEKYFVDARRRKMKGLVLTFETLL